MLYPSGKVDYSLATLTQTATIKESLNYGLTTLKTDGLVVDNATNLIAGRFENTTPSNSAVDAKQLFREPTPGVSSPSEAASFPAGNVLTRTYRRRHCTLIPKSRESDSDD